MADDTYNGWTNRETWALALRLSNDEGSYDLVREWAAECVQSAVFTEDTANVRARAEWRLGDRIRKFVDECAEIVYNDALGAGEQRWARMMLSDVGSTWRVDYNEIAGHYTSDAFDEALS